MAQIVPFVGLRYNPEKVPNLASVVTPPYDVIDEKGQARYYAESPINIIRLELGLIFPEDDEKNNRYTRAKKYLDRWLEDESLIAEKQPSFYFYQQEFPGPNGNMVRNGFICGLKVQDYSQGEILPHEETLSKPKEDRLKLMEATESNFSSIFGLYNDPEKFVDSLLLSDIEGRTPDVAIVDEAGEFHRLWVIDNHNTVQRIIEFLEDKKIYIADGHHRYETALEYSRRMKEAGRKGHDYVMTTMVNLHDEGLVILPTHRVVGNIKNFKLQDLKESIAQLCEIEEFGPPDHLDEFMAGLAQRGKKKHVFGMYTPERILYFLTIKNMNQAKSMLLREKSDAWKKLDVVLLDNLILDRLLGIGETERKNQDHLAYTRDEKWALEKVDDRTYQLAFILNPTRVDEVVAVAEAQDKMPQKSTYFYPKLTTGLVLNPLFKNV